MRGKMRVAERWHEARKRATRAAFTPFAERGRRCRRQAQWRRRAARAAHEYGMAPKEKARTPRLTAENAAPARKTAKKVSKQKSPRREHDAPQNVYFCAAA